MKKNCFNCKHLLHESGCDDPSEEMSPAYDYCNKRGEEVEDRINLLEYQEKPKRCFEPEGPKNERKEVPEPLPD